MATQQNRRRERLVSQFARQRITEDDPRWNARTMGNRRYSPEWARAHPLRAKPQPKNLNYGRQRATERLPHRDIGLGQAAAQITASTAPAQFRQNQATPAQTASWMQTIGREKAPQTGGRAYSTFGAKNTQAGNPRAGQQYQTFVKRDKSGDIYRYHQYTGKGGRRVVRVGGPVNRELH